MPQNLKTMRVLVTPTSYAKHDPRLTQILEETVGEVVYNPTSRPLTSEELRNLLPGCDGFIAGLDVIDQAALDAADRLKVIARYGVGVERVDLEAAHAKGICVTNTPSANSNAVAELTLGLMLALARQIPTAVTTTRAGEWRRLSGVSLEGKTIGLIGFGNIGRAVARRVKAFDTTVLAYDPYPNAAAADELGVRLTTLDDLLPAADIVSLHLPVVAETFGMVNAAFLAQMKRGSYLVNTARGDLIDEAALLAALESGQVAGAALDCFKVEPPGADNALLQLEQVIATPHSGAHTDGATNAMGWGALENCLAVLRGEPALNPVIPCEKP
ncbi:MAG: phosphoglycerate dehydrogenase [Anaerolineaceae bacterium]|nr:phosphoglycerate dehydrogenase [Anaerolineaceae bacterium]